MPSAVLDDPARTRARELIVSAASAGGRIAIVYHADADGISSAALACDVVERLGGAPVPLTPAKGTNVYHPAFRGALQREHARLAIFLDTGSRAGASWQPTPAIVVDHHVATEPPDVAAFVHDERAISTSLLARNLFAPIDPRQADDDRAWVAALGALGDAGDKARDEPFVTTALAKHRGLRELVALINASGRASTPAPEVALAALRRADGPSAITRGSDLAARRLREMRKEVAAAVSHARRVAPRIRGRWAIIEIAEPCRVHGIIASAWARRLSPRMVLVANRGYVEGRVHVSVRSHLPIDLRVAMRALLPGEGGDYAAGHSRATGAIVDVPTYERLRRAIDQESAATLTAR